MEPASSLTQRFKRFANSPLTLLLCILFGSSLAWLTPAFSKTLSVVGFVYVDLLKMIVLPFMVSAVILSLQKIFRAGNSTAIIGRVIIVFGAFSLVAALAGAAGNMIIRPGTDMSPSTKAALGRILNADVDNSNTQMSLYTAEATPKPLSLFDVVTSFIPTNIFASLANGEMLKVLTFALIFGVAMGKVPGKTASSLEHSLETIYQACQGLTRWINLPVPFVLVCMTASQLADTGFETMRAMIGFVGVFIGISSLLLLAAVVVLAHRACCSYAKVLDSMREPFSLGVATNNSATCMPAMVDALAEKLKFSRSQSELLVPLSVTVLRSGAMVYFVCGTLFIAALYGRQLSSTEVGLTILVSVLSGFASTGMAGIATIAMIGSACQYLGMPFEAAFLLLVAVDPICAMARTVVTVIGSCAAVAMVCTRPIRSESI